MRSHDTTYRQGFLKVSCVFLSAALVALLVTPAATAVASPPDTAWAEDVHLHPSGPAELVLAYELQRDDIEGLDADVDLFALRAAVGFDRAPMDFSPTLALRQVGALGTQVDHIGLRARYRLAGTPAVPLAAVFGGYRLVPGDEHAHEIEQGAAARWVSGGLAVGGELSARERLAGVQTQVELRLAASVTYGVLVDMVRFGVETFALVPVAGPRLSDSAQGAADEDTEALALYAGPSLRINAEYLWLSGSAAIGQLTGDGAPLLVRATVGVQF
jgi:hypothetical protein